jgi:hypothetical protein
MVYISIHEQADYFFIFLRDCFRSWVQVFPAGCAQHQDISVQVSASVQPMMV